MPFQMAIKGAMETLNGPIWLHYFTAELIRLKVESSIMCSDSNWAQSGSQTF